MDLGYGQTCPIQRGVIIPSNVSYPHYTACVPPHVRYLCPVEGDERGPPLISRSLSRFDPPRNPTLQAIALLYKMLHLATCYLLDLPTQNLPGDIFFIMPVVSLMEGV